MSEYESGMSGGANATDFARQEDQPVKRTAMDAVSNVGDSAVARGRQIRGQATQHARTIAGDARRQLRGHAHEETQRAGAALSAAGQQLRALADGRVDDAGVFGDYVEVAADAVSRWAGTVQDRGLDGLLDDVRSFGRRRPGLFLAGALVAGVVAGRFGRNAAQELRDDGETSDRFRSSASRSSGSSSGATDHDAAAWRPAGGLVGVGRSGEPVGGGVGGSTQRLGAGPGDETGERAGDDVIVGHASDDSAVVVSPGGTTADETAGDQPIAPPRDTNDDHWPVDSDRERAR